MKDFTKELNIFTQPPVDFTFNEELHKYHYGKQHLTSVTQLISKFGKKFDSDYWASRKANDAGITVEEILEQWNIKATLGTTVGSIFHEWVENYLNGFNPPMPDIKDNIGEYSASEIEQLIRIRIVKWLELYHARLHKLTPVAQELRVWSLKYGLAGTIDGLFSYKNKLIVGDWKSNKQFRTDDDKTFQYLLWPFDNEADNEHNKYSLQVSLYRVILEEYGIETGPAFLCWVPAEDTPAAFIPAKDYRKLLKEYLNDSISL